MASLLDDLLGNVVDKLKSAGIGVKNKYDIEAETDPYIKYIRSGGYVRGDPFTPEIAEARRRYMARKKARQTAVPQDYRTPSNIQAQSGQGTIGDQVSYYNLNPTDPATSYSNMTRSSAATADGMGGYGQGGLFSPADRASAERKGVTPSSRGLSGVQAASDFFNFFTPPENVTRGLPEDEANNVTDIANTYFSGELPMPKWRVQDAESSSLGTDNRGNPILSREDFDANIEANLENLRLRRRFPEQGPPPNYRGGFEGTGEFTDIPTLEEPVVRSPSVNAIDPEQVYRQRQAQAPLRLQVLRDLISQGRVDSRQAGNPYVERLIDMEIAKMQESSPETGLFDTRASVGNPFNAAVNEARQKYNEANSMDSMPPEPPAIIDVQPAQSEAQYWKERLGDGFGGGSGADMVASRAQLVEPQFSERFTGYLQKVEGLKTDTGKTPFRYKSPEGGNDTVGIGHKLTDAEVKSGKVYGYDLKTLTKEQAQDILQKDLAKTKSVLSKNLTNKYKKSFEDLTPKQQEMLLDLQFNVKDSGKGGGILEFPKFTEALLKNDLETMRKEYKRYYKDPKTKENVSLGRNKDFFNTYLK